MRRKIGEKSKFGDRFGDWFEGTKKISNRQRERNQLERRIRKLQRDRVLIDEEIRECQTTLNQLEQPFLIDSNQSNVAFEDSLLFQTMLRMR